jgi:hypothetical protein
MIETFLMLLAVHWIGDFVLQSHWMASNKSKNPFALLAHVGVYTAVLAFASVAMFGGSEVTARFVVANAALHFLTDRFSSMTTARLWAKQDWHNFFVVIGFDQLIHQLTLGWTMVFFFGSAS